MKIYLLVIVLIILIIFMFNQSFKIENYLNKPFLPKKVWIYWDTSINKKLPKSVIFCIQNIKYLNKNWNIHLITTNSITKYVKCDRTLNILKSKEKVNFKSDLIRLYLIYNYGGVYLDASVCLFESLDWVIKLINNKNQIVVYINSRYSDEIANVYESWFIVASPKNYIIKIWLDMFLNLLEKGVENSYRELLQNKIIRNQKFCRIHKSYHLVYFTFIQSQLLYPQLSQNIISIDCNKKNYPCKPMYSSGPNKKQENWLFTKPINDLEFNKIKKYKLVKYTSYNRKAIDKIDAKYNYNSFFYHLYYPKL